jgi:hypothetical protein
MKNFEIKYTITGNGSSFSSTENISAENSKGAEIAFVEGKYGFTDCSEWNEVAQAIRNNLTITSVKGTNI